MWQWFKWYSEAVQSACYVITGNSTYFSETKPGSLQIISIWREKNLKSTSAATIQPAFLVKWSSNLELLHRNTWKNLTGKTVSFDLSAHSVKKNQTVNFCVISECHDTGGLTFKDWTEWSICGVGPAGGPGIACTQYRDKICDPDPITDPNNPKVQANCYNLRERKRCSPYCPRMYLF